MMRTTILMIIAFVLLWNSGFVGAEFGLPYTSPFTFMLWRYIGVTLIIMVFAALRRRLRWVGWSAAAPAMLVGILAHGVWLICVLLSLDYGVPSGIVAMVVALQPMATGALSGLVVGEPTSLRRWIGLLVGLAGVTITLWARIDFSNTQSVLGYLIPFGSVLSMTAANLIQRRLELYRPAQRLSVDVNLFYQALATTVVMAIPAVFFEDLRVQWTPEFMGTLVWLVVAVSLGAYAFMWLLLIRMEANRVAALFYLGPPVTMLMAWAVFGHTLLMTDVAGLAVVFAGVILTMLPFQQKEKGKG